MNKKNTLLKFPRFLRALSWDDYDSSKSWAENEIVLTSDVSPITGAMSFDDNPHMIEMLEDWDRGIAEEFVFYASTQVGKTTVLFVIMSNALDTDPCMMQLTIPVDKGVSDYLDTKLNPFFKCIKNLQNKMVDHKEMEKQRDKGAIKKVPNGMLFILGNTANNRRSKTVKYIFIDEAALFGQGHIEELKGRTKSFEGKGRKVFIVSSPKHDGDEIVIAYEDAYCKKLWHLECPKCHKNFAPSSEHLKFMTEAEYKKKYEIDEIEKINDYKREATATAHMLCSCGHKITTQEKNDQISDGKCGFIIMEGNEEDISIGYRINALGTKNTALETIAKMLIEAEINGDEHKKETIYQDYFCEIYKTNAKAAEDTDLLLLGNGLKDWVVPKDTIRIYLGVDTQKDHFWYSLMAFGYGENSHLMSCGRVETFDDVENLFVQAWNLKDSNGKTYRINKVGIDARGYNDEGIKRTAEVKMFVAEMTSKYGEDTFYATMGEKKLAANQEYIIKREKDNSFMDSGVDIKILKINTTEMKNKFANSMTKSVAVMKGEDVPFENIARFYMSDDEIARNQGELVSTSTVRQLTAETYDYWTNGQGKKDTEKSWFMSTKTDNHIFDCCVTCQTFSFIDKVAIAKKPDDVKTDELVSYL